MAIIEAALATKAPFLDRQDPIEWLIEHRGANIEDVSGQTGGNIYIDGATFMFDPEESAAEMIARMRLELT